MFSMVLGVNVALGFMNLALFVGIGTEFFLMTTLLHTTISVFCLRELKEIDAYDD